MRALQGTLLTILVSAVMLTACGSNDDAGELIDVTGVWVLMDEPVRLTFAQDGNNVEGTDSTGATFTGVLSGNELSGTWVEHDGDTTPMTVTINGDTMTGVVVDTENGEGSVTAVRE